MRIAYITETWPPEINGVSLTVSRTVDFLRARGHDVQLMRPRQPGEEARDDLDEWRSPGMPIPLYPDLRFGLATSGMLQSRLSKGMPHLVHVATPGPLGRAAVIAASALQIPVTSDFRTNFHWYSRHYGVGWAERLVVGYLRAVHNRSERTFVPTAHARDQLLAHGFERVQVVSRGVDTQRFAPQWRRQSLRASWDAPADGPVLLYVGRLAPEKNIDLAFEAYAESRRRNPATRMVVVGDGPLGRRLRTRHPDVHFTGTLRGPELASAYASADVFLFPSLSETFGNVTLEAMASGLAVVAFDAAAAAERIRAGVNGFVVPPEEPHAFVTAACEAATAGERLLPLRLRAREVAVAARWEAVLQRFERALLQTALQPRTGEASGVPAIG